MRKTPPTKAEGWVKLDDANKAHYFRKTRALCGLWSYHGKRFMNPHPLLGFRCGKCNRLKDKK